jgi:hypothetical protein
VFFKQVQLVTLGRELEMEGVCEGRYEKTKKVRVLEYGETIEEQDAFLREI